jgi:hypothetical protein
MATKVKIPAIVYTFVAHWPNHFAGEGAASRFADPLNSFDTVFPRWKFRAKVFD